MDTDTAWRSAMKRDARSWDSEHVQSFILIAYLAFVVAGAVAPGGCSGGEPLRPAAPKRDPRRSEWVRRTKTNNMNY